MYGNDDAIDVYCGRNRFYAFELVPDPVRSRAKFTRIGMEWVRQESLSMCQYDYCEIDGYYHIFEPLNYVSAHTFALRT
jgi:hypothetical protein